MPYFVHRGHSEVTGLVLNAKANVSVEDTSGRTPLFFGDYHDTACMTQTLPFRASVSLHDIHRRTPLHYVALRDGDDAATKLLRSGSYINVQDLHDESIVRTTVKYYSQTVSKFRLSKKDLEVQLINDAGYDLFHFAVIYRMKQ